jgi:hypothetical protein
MRKPDKKFKWKQPTYEIFIFQTIFPNLHTFVLEISIGKITFLFHFTSQYKWLKKLKNAVNVDKTQSYSPFQKINLSP